MGKPTRYPNGVTTGEVNGTLGDYILPSPVTAHEYWDDFDYYTAVDWTVTEVGVATQALADEDGGVLLVTNAAADNNSSFSQKVGESFLFETGKALYFEARLKVSDATQSDWIMGLQITDTTPLDVTDGVFFRKDDGDTNIDFVVERDNTATTSVVATNADDTYIRLGFYFDGTEKLIAFVNDEAIVDATPTNIPNDEVLTISFGIQNGEAVAKTMSVDYIFAAKER